VSIKVKMLPSFDWFRTAANQTASSARGLRACVLRPREAGGERMEAIDRNPEPTADIMRY